MIMLAEMTKPAECKRVLSKHEDIKRTDDTYILSKFTSFVNRVENWLNNDLPAISGPAIYLLFDDNNNPQYVGVVFSPHRTVKKRLSEHLAPTTLTYSDRMGWEVLRNLPHSKNWRLVIYSVPTCFNVKAIERELIRKLRPTINHYYNPNKTKNDMGKWGRYV